MPEPTRSDPAHIPPLTAPGLFPAFAIVAAAILLVGIPAWFGLLSLPALALLAITAGTLGLAILRREPRVLAIAIPALLFSPMLVYTYAWELLLGGSLALLVFAGWHRRAPWLQRASWPELVMLALTAWAVFTGFWSDDARNYLIQFRRVMLGLGTFWFASRLWVIAPRRWFEFGLLLTTLTLGLAALGHQLTSGLSHSEALMRRPEATNLGWGTANFIATLLLLLAPIVLALATQRRGRMRVVGWLSTALNAIMQLVIASRAASVLFVGGTLVQVLGQRGRRAFWTALAVLGGLAGLLASPLGQPVFDRFTNLRELGSMTIRIWYLREGWRRLIEHQPFGLGLGQGYAYPDKLHGLDPHNYWLDVGGDLGIPGLLLWCALLLLIWKALGRMSRTPDWVVMGRALRISFVMAQLHTLVEPTYQGSQYQFLFYWVFGGFLGYHAHEHPEAQRAAAPGAEEPAASSAR